jgi:hypothetical protein
LFNNCVLTIFNFSITLKTIDDAGKLSQLLAQLNGMVPPNKRSKFWLHSGFVFVLQDLPQLTGDTIHRNPLYFNTAILPFLSCNIKHGKTTNILLVKIIIHPKISLGKSSQGE